MPRSNATGCRINDLVNYQGVRDKHDMPKGKRDKGIITACRDSEASGASAENVVKIQVLVVDHKEEYVGYIQSEMKKLFGVHLPASTLIPAPGLVSSRSSLPGKGDSIHRTGTRHRPLLLQPVEELGKAA